MPEAIQFTIAICTCNRGDVLSLSLDAALAQRLDGAEYEVLVVDNLSTDGTAALLDRRIETEPRMRRVIESTQGLSFARNRAVEEAHGTWIVFVDDDAELCPGYLTALQGLIADCPNAGAAGGPIDVGWLGPVPDWYEPTMDGMFNQLRLASYRMPIKYPSILYGTNMAFPVALLREIGGFETRLGRIGKGLLACEDGEILLRIQTRTARPIMWDPALRVNHLIYPGRLTLEYMKQKVEWNGRSQCLLEKLYPGSGQTWGMLCGLLENLARIVLNRPRGRQSERLFMAYNLGYLKQRLKPLPREFKSALPASIRP